VKPGDLVKTDGERVSLHRETSWDGDNPVTGIFKPDNVGMVLATTLHQSTDKNHDRTEWWCLVLCGLVLGWRETKFFVVVP
jgi:hypothetical protein